MHITDFTFLKSLFALLLPFCLLHIIYLKIEKFGFQPECYLDRNEVERTARATLTAEADSEVLFSLPINIIDMLPGVGFSGVYRFTLCLFFH